jgi:beta-galactosidase
MTPDASLPRRRLLRAGALGGAAVALGSGSPGWARSANSVASKPAIRDLLFDDGWLFHLGDAPQAERPEFDASAWRRLDLPHDWSLEDRPGAPKTADPWVPPNALWNLGDHPADAQPVSPELPIVMASVPPMSADGPPRRVGPFDADAAAFGWGTGWTVGGVGWYRKPFRLADLAPGEQVEVRFDGAFLVTEAWLNGHSLGRNINGYLGFAFDLTPHLLTDRPNILAVRVANIGETARWYSGSGLYRHVWLSRTGPVRAPLWGVAITTTSVDQGRARLAVGIEVENRATQAADVECRIAIRTAAGKVVATADRKLALAPGARGRVDAMLVVNGPLLWSPETPNIHEAEITLISDGSASDRLNQRFGIRTLRADPQSGFQVNGKTYQLRGVCLHHDNGLLGAAAIDRAERRKVELVKANGFNAIRCSHNPPSPHFLDACDELGMIVIDEAFDVWERPKLLKDAYNVYFQGVCLPAQFACPTNTPTFERRASGPESRLLA